jgi:hypothetical protein
MILSGRPWRILGYRPCREASEALSALSVRRWWASSGDGDG